MAAGLLKFPFRVEFACTMSEQLSPSLNTSVVPTKIKSSNIDGDVADYFEDDSRVFFSKLPEVQARVGDSEYK